MTVIAYRNLTFEKAYAEYRLNRTSDALKTLKAVDQPSDREKELLGQVVSVQCKDNIGVPRQGPGTAIKAQRGSMLGKTRHRQSLWVLGIPVGGGVGASFRFSIFGGIRYIWGEHSVEDHYLHKNWIIFWGE